MRLSIVDQTGQLTSLQRTQLRRRLRIVLTRFSGHLRGVRLTLGLAPDGAVEAYRCHGSLVFQDSVQRDVTARGDELADTAVRVVDRLGRAAARAVDCGQPGGRRVASRL